MKALIGAHMSAAGGLEQALLRGRALDCSVIQLFTKNTNQWKERSLKHEEIIAFQEKRKETGIGPIFSHGSYLVNLASPNPVIHKKSVQATLCELQRCQLLGIEYLVIHPGAYREEGEREGMRRIIRTINSIQRQTQEWVVTILLETTAGQGTYIGSRLEQLAEIIAGVEYPERVGVCLDTCHVFAAGYDLRSFKKCEEFFIELEKIIGLEKLKLIHLNDSLTECGSRTDRHAHIGQGKIGADAFRWIMRSSSLEQIPKIIETPKEENMDTVNLDILRTYASV